jgi:uncharacterized protein YjdB
MRPHHVRVDRFVARAYLNGNTITSTSFTWASSATNVVSINASTGLATGLAPGTAQVAASADGVASPAATAAVDAVATIKYHASF